MKTYEDIAREQQGIPTGNNIRLVQLDVGADGRCWKRTLKPFKTVEEAQREADFRNEVIPDVKQHWKVER